MLEHNMQEIQSVSKLASVGKLAPLMMILFIHVSSSISFALSNRQ